MEIKNKFNIIQGKFLSQDLNQLQLGNYISLLDDIPKISLEKLLILYKKNSKGQKNLIDNINFIEIIAKYTQITQKDIEFLDKYLSFLESCISLLKLNHLNLEKKKLKIELKIAQERNKSAEIATKITLLNKLNESINEYHTRLKLFEEDFLSIKNQKKMLELNLENLKKTQIILKKEQKDIFNQINILTREEENQSDNQNKKIETLRKNAKILRDKINNLKQKIENSQYKLNQNMPKFKEFDKIYHNLKENLEIDKKKMKNLQMELEEVIDLDKLDEETEYGLKELSYIRPISLIKSSINNITKEIIKIESFNHKYFKNENDLLIKDLEQFKSNLDDFFSKELKEFDINELKSKIKSLNKLGIWLYKFQKLLNEFLETINLKISIDFFFNLTPNFAKNSQIIINFKRVKEEAVIYDNLTTPEKVFFIICFYLTIESLKNKRNIIFTNLSIPKDYNKKGSIFRTLTKIMPVFNESPDLKEKSLTFLISGFKLSKDIKNVQLYNINNT